MFGGEGGEGCVGDVVIHPRASFHAAIHKKVLRGITTGRYLCPATKMAIILPAVKYQTAIDNVLHSARQHFYPID